MAPVMVGFVELGTLHSLELRGRHWPHFRRCVTFGVGLIRVCHNLANNKLRLEGVVRDFDDFLRGGTEIAAICYRASDDRFGPGTCGLVARHEFGDEGGRLPRLLYSDQSPGELAIAGGDYWVGPEGIRN